MRLELVRALFPRWNFFDHVSTQLTLEVKSVGASAWQSIPFEAERTFLGLIVNPKLVLMHAEQSLLENFVQDLARVTEADGSVSSANVSLLTTYKMVRTLIVDRVELITAGAFQFRVLAPGEIIYVSDVVSGVIS